MIDMEKVTKGLKCLTTCEKDRTIMVFCETCPYNSEEYCTPVIANDALAILKEQENANKRNPVIVCPHCGKRVK